MAYRFINTNKYDDPWFLDLEPNSKLLFDYLICKVNNAGFLEESIRRICFDIGWEKDIYLGAKQGLKRGLIISNDEKIIYLKNFLKHQKNLPLNKYNNAHKNIFELLRDGIKNFNENTNFFLSLPCHHILRSKENILENKEENLGAYLGLISPIGKGNSNGKGKEFNNNGEDEKIKYDESVSDGIIFAEFDSIKAELHKSEIWLSDVGMSLDTPVSSIKVIKSFLDKFLKKQKPKGELKKPLGEIKSHFSNWLNKNIDSLKVDTAKVYSTPKATPKPTIKTEKSPEEIEMIMWIYIRDFWIKFKEDPKPEYFLTFASFDFLLNKKIITTTDIERIDIIDFKPYIEQAESRVMIDVKRNKSAVNVMQFPKTDNWKDEMLNDFLNYKPKLHFQELVYNKVKQNMLWRWFKYMLDTKADVLKLIPVSIKPAKQLA